MIPGVLRGVIASSWLRASDQLRAPNAITTGQDIPAVEIVERQQPRHEVYLGIQNTLAISSTRDARIMMRPVFVVKRNP